MYNSTLTTKGQTTIPLRIRNILNIMPGDRIDYIANDDGTVTIIPSVLDVRDLQGILKKQNDIVSIEQMNEKARQLVINKRLKR